MHEQMHRKYLAPRLYPVEGSSDYNHDHYTTQNYPLISMYAWDKGTTYWFCQDPLYKVTEELDFTVHSTHKQWWWWQYVHVRPCMPQHTCGGQGKALQSFFPFYLYGGSGDQTQVISIAQQEPLPPGLPHQCPVESLNRAGADLSKLERNSSADGLCNDLIFTFSPSL